MQWDERIRVRGVVRAPDFLVDRPVQQQLLCFSPFGFPDVINIGGVSQCNENGYNNNDDHQFNDGEARAFFSVCFHKSPVFRYLIFPYQAVRMN
jgi:hypothetical protein